MWIIEETLNAKDQSWVRTEIGTAIQAATKIRSIRSLKEFGTAGAFITLCGAAAIFIFTQISGNSKFQGATEQRFLGIESQLSSLRVLMAASQPEREQNQRAAREVLADVRTKKPVPAIPLSEIEQAGQAFIQAAPSNLGAWKTALEFVNYRSSLNVSPPGPVKPVPQVQGQIGTVYHLSEVQGLPQPKMAYVTNEKDMPQDQAARAELISKPILQKEPTGIGTFVVVGGAITLDDTYLRHVILDGVEVHYSGGLVRIEDVRFVNCRFVMDNQPTARQLASSILQSGRVTLALS